MLIWFHHFWFVLQTSALIAEQFWKVKSIDFLTIYFIDEGLVRSYDIIFDMEIVNAQEI